MSIYVTDCHLKHALVTSWTRTYGRVANQPFTPKSLIVLVINQNLKNCWLS